MPRWEPDGADRLQAAALDLFDRRGFDQTTVADITALAGLTQRSFFNHYADKREVLFNLSAPFQDEVIGVLDVVEMSAPLDAVVKALTTAAASLFEPRKGTVLRRHRIVARTPDLRERELAKQATLAAAVTDALRRRGLDPQSAQLAAGTGLLVLRTAVENWSHPEEDRTLGELLALALAKLRSTIAATPDSVAGSASAHPAQRDQGHQ